MRVFRQLGVLVLLLATCAAPVMACMVPQAAMSAQERACCRMMKGQCGQMEMPASDGCCQKTPPSVHDNALFTKAVTFQPVAAVVVWIATFQMADASGRDAGWVDRSRYSQPKSPPRSIFILRI